MIAKKIIKIAQTGVHDAAQLSALAITQLGIGKAASVGGLFQFECRLLCRFSDAGMRRPSPRSDSRRPKSVKARNRGVWSTDSAAGAMGIWRRRECWGS